MKYLQSIRARIDGTARWWRSGAMRTLLPAVLGLAFVLGACAGPGEAPARETDPDFHPTVGLLTKYDANNDGTVTRAEMEAGLRKEFEAADTNHDGRLDSDEAGAVNAQRWEVDKSTASTIVDWNQDGYIDFNEFAGTARSLFAEIDRDHDGQLSPAELKAYEGRKKRSDGDRDQDQPEQNRGHRHGGPAEGN
jgi:Ca2+-binding EF-hand superfamily protein